MQARQNIQGISLYTQAGKRKYVTPAERAQFIEAALASPRPEVCALCLTLAYTGCRISEALALTLDAIDAVSGSIAIFSLKKRGKIVVREIPAPPDLFAALKRNVGLVQIEANDRIWTLCRNRAWQLIKEVMDAAGIPRGAHAMPKGLRHGFGIHALRQGVPLPLVQRWLGHASIETTAIYLQAMGCEEREFAERMW